MAEDEMAGWPTGFSRQGYWSGVPRPPPGDLPNPRIELRSLKSPAQRPVRLKTELWGHASLPFLRGCRSCWKMLQSPGLAEPDFRVGLALS